MDTKTVAHITANMSPSSQLNFVSHGLPELEELHYMKQSLSSRFNVDNEVKTVKNQLKPKQNRYKNMLLSAKLKALNDIQFKNYIHEDKVKTIRDESLYRSLLIGFVIFLAIIITR